MSNYETNKIIKVAIVDDKQANRVSLSEKLLEQKDITVLLMAKNGDDFLNKMKEAKELPDVVLMDIDMPMMNGIEAVNTASELYPSTNFLMLTVFDDDEKFSKLSNAELLVTCSKTTKLKVLSKLFVK